ncbi:response regulator [Paenibacillus antri]|uniref:histidine kinase n=1 Tax=Paenibacillus antri TaxID=2582848 RepID=A0A5R9GBW7_9BACL|nr:response regulator [Paenibacillus antri]TLS52579.1 response regulator [Paenibacillus antri]
MYSMLIVDDHKHLVESLAATVPWDEYRITRIHKAYNGKQALQIVMEQDIHVLITDIRMPEMSGLELIETIRQRQLDIECILLTGIADFRYAKQAIELQAVNYLLKPVRVEELLPSIRAIADRLEERRSAEAEQERIAAEERRRIGHDLHDILGFTLTSTLMNLEAAKMLLAANREEGLKRLEQSSELLRSGMLTIRQAVRTVQQGRQETELVASLRAFLADAERLAGVTIVSEFEPEAATVDPSFAKTALHAVQEGITNGIRHGGATRFLFRLQLNEGKIRLSLWNDGRPYDGGSEQGIGLAAMRERVEAWGGAVELTSTAEPSGTLLRLTLPYGA